MALWGLTASRSFLTPVSHTVISGKTQYLIVPRFGMLLLPPFVKTDKNWALKISALVWTVPFFLSYSAAVVFLAFDETPKLLQIAPILVAFSYHGVNVLVIRLAAL